MKVCFIADHPYLKRISFFSIPARAKKLLIFAKKYNYECMQYKITFPNSLKHATIALPASKSISARALIINALCESGAEVANLADCDDTRVLTNALASAGSCFDVGAAGTAMRFLTAFLSNRPGDWTITGTARMKQRPIAILVDALRELGARVTYLENEGFPPLRIVGRELSGGEASLPANVSSQYISALLLLAPMMEQGLTIHLDGEPTSVPYIDLTIGLMKRFGADVAWSGKRDIKVQPKKYISTPFAVESDWSAASYWYSMVSLANSAVEIELTGLSRTSMQGDACVSKIYERLGVRTIFTDAGVRIRREGECCRRLEYDFGGSPDLAQTLTVGCCLLNVPFRFTGLHTLRIKETDRIAALRSELLKLGYAIESIDGISLEWNGDNRRNSCYIPSIQTYDDHRMAMSFAPAALRINDGIIIAQPEVVSKSYPQFWEHLALAGAQASADCTD